MFGDSGAEPARSAGKSSRPAQSVTRSAGSLLAARLIGATAGWIGTVVIVRELTRGEFGGYSFIFGLLGLIGLIVDLQTSRIVLTEVLRSPDDAGRLVGSYTLMRTAIGAIAYVAAVAIVVVGGYDEDVVLGTVVGGLGFLFIAPNNGIAVWFHARLWMRPTLTGSLIASSLQLGLVLAFAASGNGSIVTFAAALTAAEAAILFWRLWCTHRYGLRLRFGVDLAQWWHWLRESIPLAIGFGLVSIYYKLDIILLSQLDTLSSVGLYTIGYKFADLANFIPYAVATPIMTLMIAAWPGAPHRVALYFRQAFITLFVLAVGIAIGFALVAAPLVDLLYGVRYHAAIDAARLLVVGSTLQFFSYLCFVTLASVKHDRAFALGGLVGLALNLGLNVLLIPEFSFEGAAVATVLTEAGVLAVLMTAIRRTEITVSIPWGLITRTLIAGAVMASIYLGVRSVAPWPVAAAAGAATFVLLLHVLSASGPGGLRTLINGLRFDGATTQLDDGDVYPPIAWNSDAHDF